MLAGALFLPVSEFAHLLVGAGHGGLARDHGLGRGVDPHGLRLRLTEVLGVQGAVDLTGVSLLLVCEGDDGLPSRIAAKLPKGGADEQRRHVLRLIWNDDEPRERDDVAWLNVETSSFAEVRDELRCWRERRKELDDGSDGTVLRVDRARCDVLFE